MSKRHKYVTDDLELPRARYQLDPNETGMTMEEKNKYMQNFAVPLADETVKYEKMTKIGHGSFGEVFKARLKSDPQQIVAMKKILLHSEKDGFPVTALREIKILQVLKHTNIVSLIEICRSTQQGPCIFAYHLIFEFCEHDLAGLLANASVTFSLGEIKNVMQQLLSGLFYIHHNKILHRDMKAANILVTKAGVLKLADFGLARAFSRVEEGKCYTNFVVTLWYRPPELLLGEKNYDITVDLWGAGCIMAELWSREPIFQGRTEQQQLTLISQMCGSITPEVWDDVEKLELYNNMELPQGFKRTVKEFLAAFCSDVHAGDLLDKFLALDPAKRIQSNAALDHDFFWEDPLPCDLQNMLAKYRRSMFELLANPGNAGQEDDNAGAGYRDRVF